MKKLLAALAALGLLVLAACDRGNYTSAGEYAAQHATTAAASQPSATGLGSGKRALAITLTLIDIDMGVKGAACEDGGIGGYSDINQATQVVVTDQDGTIIGSGQLGDQVQQLTEGLCRWTTEIDVPTDRDQYSVEVSHRGKITRSRATLDAGGWQINVQLGSLPN